MVNRRLYLAVFFVFCSCFFVSAHEACAANSTWTGSVSSDWATAGNWSLSAVPTSSDNVTIPDAGTTANDPSISAGAVCSSLTISAGGILNGNAQTITVSGDWTNSGSFNHGNGTVKFGGGSANGTFVPGASVYGNIEVNKNGPYYWNDLIVNGTAAVSGNFTQTIGELRSGQIDLAGNYVIGASSYGGSVDADDATVINFNHATNDQQIIYSAGGVGANIRIDKAGGTLTVSSDIIVNGWAYVRGAVSGIDTHTLIFGDDYNGTFTPGSLTYGNVELNKSETYYRDHLHISGTANISGNLIQTRGEFWEGQINVSGNYIIGAAAAGAPQGSAPTIINLNSATNQSILYSAGGIGSHIRIDKAGGTLDIPSDISVNGWEYIQGTVTGLGTHTLIFGDDSNGSFVPGNLVYGNMELSKNSGYTNFDVLVVSGTASVSGNLVHTDGELMTGQINLSGNYTIGSLATGSQASTTPTILNFNHGSNNQQIIYNAGGVGAHIRVDKAGGTLSIESDINVNGWEYVQGTVTGLSTYTLTFGDDNNGSFVPGALTYGNIVMNKVQGYANFEHLYVSGTLNMSGGLTVTHGEFNLNYYNAIASVTGNVIISADGILSAGTNLITVRGSWTNSGTFNHGSGALKFNGSDTSTFTPGSSAYNNIEVNQTSGSTDHDHLDISGTVTLSGNLTHTDGRMLGGKINLAGNYTIGAAASGSYGSSYATVVNFNHASNNQSVAYTAGGVGAHIRIDKVGGTFSIPTDVTVSGWAYAAGTVSGVNNHTITFAGEGSGSFVPGALTYANLIINKTIGSTDYDHLDISGTATLSGNLTHTDGRILGGQINLAGNYTIGAAASGSYGSSYATVVNFNHASNNQSVIYTAGGVGAQIRIDKVGGTFSLASDISISGWAYAAGTVSGVNNHTITFAGEGSDSFAPGALTYANLIINKTIGSTDYDNLYVSAGTLTVSGNLTVTDGELVMNSNNPTVNVSGSVSIAAAGTMSAGTNPISVIGNWTNSGTFNHGNGSVIFAESSASTSFSPGSSSYYNLELRKITNPQWWNNDWDNLFISGTATVLGNFSQTSGDVLSGRINVAGNYIIGAQARGSMTDYSYSSTVINFNGTGNQAIVYSAGGIGAAIRIDKASGTLTVSDNLTVNGWSYIRGDVTGVDNHTISFGDDTYGSFTPGSLTYGNIELNKTNSYYNYGWNGLSISGTATISGNFLHTAGRAGSGQLNVSGNYIIGAASEGSVRDYSTESTIVNLVGTGSQSITTSGTGEGDHIRIDKASGTLSIGSDLIVNSWTYVRGTVTDISGYTLTFGDTANSYFNPGSLIYGDVIINKTDHSNGWDRLNIGSGTINIEGDLNFVEGQLIMNAGNPNINIGGDFSIGSSNATFTRGTGTIIFNGTTPSVVTDAHTTPQNIGTIILNKTSTIEADNKLTLASNVTCNTLSIDGTSGQADTLDLGNGGYILTLANAGNTATVFTVNGTVVPGDATIKYAATNSAGNINIAPASYNNLELSGAETYALSGTTTLAGNLIVGATSILSAGTNTINLSGNLTNSGTFTPDTSTVNLTGTNQSLSGNTTFYNLSKDITTSDTLTFAADSTTTINPSGTLTLKGQDRDNRLSLVSSTPNTQWNLAVNDASIYDFDFINVQDSNATTRHLSVLNSLDAGNNTNWTIVNNTATGITTPSINVAGSTVTIHTTASDTDHDNISLKIEYSIDNGSTWHDPYLSSTTTSTGTPALVNANEYQITGITTASDNTVTILWDTKSEQNELSSILFEDDIKIKLTPYDGTDIGSTQTSSPFEVNNRSAVFVPSSKPDLSDIEISSDNDILHFTNLPADITQIAISSTSDFQEVSYQDINDIINLSDYATDTIYFKFRTSQGSTSDTITYNKTSHTTSSDLKEGDIVKTKDNFDVYIIKYKNGKQYKRLILSPSVFNSYHHLKWENIKIISQSEMDRYTTSELVQVAGDQNIYKLFPSGDTGERKILDASISYDADSVYEINKVDRDNYTLKK